MNDSIHSNPSTGQPPAPAERPQIILPESDEDLLDECEVDTFRSSGPGGQNVNKTESAVRLRHLPSGIVVQSQEERSQLINKQHCLTKLRARVAALNFRPKPRKATKLSKGAKRRHRVAKTQHSQKKQVRQARNFGED
ncbi:MAG: Peptide chain release factor 2 [Fibrobacterota bacterium]|jgi:protein subunit release factor B